MAKQHLRTLGLSLFLHALLVLLFAYRSEKTPVRPPLKPDTNPLAVELTESPTTSTASRPHAASGSNRSSGKTPPSSENGEPLLLGGDFLRQNLVTRFSKPTSQPGEDSDQDSQEQSGSGHGWSPATQETNRMTIQKTLETLPFFMTLHSRVNSVLVYPDDFSRQRITGRVRIEVELGRDGTLKRFLTSTTDDRLLQTYCFALLLQTLARPLPSRAHLTEGESIAVSFEFEFHARIVGAPKRGFPTVIQKNHLAFGRENEVDPIVTERIQEIFTHYVPPIVPLPGGVYIDFVMAYQFIQNIMNDAPTEREQRASRIETLHEDLRRFVRIGSSPTPTATPES